MRKTWRQLRARVAALDARRFDALLAAGVFAGLQIELALLPLGEDRLPAHALALVFLAGLLVRRRFPELCMLALFGGLAAYEQIPAIEDGGLLTFFAVFIAPYSLGAHVEGRRLAFGVAAGAVGVVLVIAASPANSLTFEDVVFGLSVFLAGPVLLGSILRSRARIAEALGAKARAAEAERARQAGEAVDEERTRIAAELHDVVAHALSAMVVQASAARRLVATDAEAAAIAFAAVEHSGRDALTEIRSLLGVLRREDEEIALAPQPSLAHAQSLVGRVRAAGLPVSLAVEGEPRPLPAGVDLTAYRVIQEALGEAMDPGGAGSAAVRIAYTPSDVELEVRDDGRASSRARRRL